MHTMLAHAYLAFSLAFAAVVFGLAASGPWMKRKSENLRDEVQRVKERQR